MSRQIDMTDPDSWSDDDRRYLQERGQLPADVDNVLPMGVQPGNAPLAPNTGTVNTVPAFDNEHEVRFKGKFDEYKGMTPAELRRELSDRELPSSGTKGELVYRLLEDDDRPKEEEPAIQEDDEFEGEVE